MSISGIGATSAATSVGGIFAVNRNQATAASQDASPTTPSAQDTFKSDLMAILDAVKGGDMDAAQAALTKLTSDQPSLEAAGYSVTGTAPASPTQTDLASLLQAVKAGDLSGAQTALTSLHSDAQAPAAAPKTQGHHHHHHHAQSATATTTSPDSSTTASPADSAITAA